MVQVNYHLGLSLWKKTPHFLLVYSGHDSPTQFHSHCIIPSVLLHLEIMRIFILHSFADISPLATTETARANLGNIRLNTSHNDDPQFFSTTLRFQPLWTSEPHCQDQSLSSLNCMWNTRRCDASAETYHCTLCTGNVLGCYVPSEKHPDAKLYDL